jgi:plasmid maintenance system killer protein
VIRSFSGGNTQKIWELRCPKGISQDLAKAARRKMQLLDAPEDINDMRVRRATVWRSFSHPAKDNTASASMTSTASASRGAMAARTMSNSSTTTER